MRNPSKITWLGTFLIIFIFSAGVFFFQWRQVKGELKKQVGQNENLIEQIEALQKEIEDLKKAEEKVTDETADWETYRDEIWGFEIDYPADEWECWREDPGTFAPLACSEKKGNFEFDSEILPFNPDCFINNWEETIKMINAGECSFDETVIINSGKKITLESGIEGYQITEGNVHFVTLAGVILPLKLKDGEFPKCPVWIIKYSTDYSDEDLKTFNKMISTFRYIED